MSPKNSTYRHTESADSTNTLRKRRASSADGYTLDEIRYRLMVNKLKIEMTRDKIAMIVSPSHSETPTDPISSYISRFSSIYRYFDIAMIAYTTVRRIVSVFRFFRPKSR